MITYLFFFPSLISLFFSLIVSFHNSIILIWSQTNINLLSQIIFFFFSSFPFNASSSSAISVEANPSNPFYLRHGDSLGSLLVFQPLIGD